MEYIDEKFKDENPVVTVQNIIDKLDALGIHLNEQWNDSKIENCQSVHVFPDGGVPSTNGKGITKELARASAYGEFIERLQSGLFFYKHQSFEKDESVYLHSFAPDKKYVTKAELLADSEWMEPICKTFNVSKEAVANACLVFNGSDKIITLPYYSLFEDKYVYLPAKFVEFVYTANGCCVGNTKEEAWVHALSEIFERHNCKEVISSGKPAPVIPREKIKNFKIANKILEKIEESGQYNVELLDYSCGLKFPVVACVIIDKKTKNYLVNIGADPVFEIAVERTLTEIFQGRNLENFVSSHAATMLINPKDAGKAYNMFNQIETGNGLYTVDFFIGTNDPDDTDSFEDNSNKTNKELLDFILKKYKDLGLNVYVRNNSFLGFPCYKFIVPGYSDIRGDVLKSPIIDYYFGDRAAITLRNIKKATPAQLSELLMYRKMIDGFISKSSQLEYLTGRPIYGSRRSTVHLHMAYAALKLKNFDEFNKFMNLASTLLGASEEGDYVRAVKQWFELKNFGFDEAKIIRVIEKFYCPDTVKKIKRDAENNSFLEEFLFECENCETCKFKDSCNYETIRNIIAATGKEYAKFTNGQDRENFKF
ncbi:MAG: YcaO-like family protein [Clostridia bacterium]|nr:YcaO-like family protein [Clostridia bacterium]